MLCFELSQSFFWLIWICRLLRAVSEISKWWWWHDFDVVMGTNSKNDTRLTTKISGQLPDYHFEFRCLYWPLDGNPDKSHILLSDKIPRLHISLQNHWFWLIYGSTASVSMKYGWHIWGYILTLSTRLGDRIIMVLPRQRDKLQVRLFTKIFEFCIINRVLS